MSDSVGRGTVDGTPVRGPDVGMSLRSRFLPALLCLALACAATAAMPSRVFAAPAAQAPDDPELDQWDRLIAERAAANERGDYIAAERAVRELQMIAASRVPPRDLLMGQMGVWLGDAAYGQRRLDEAVDYYRDALEILRAESDDPFEIDNAAYAMATILITQADYDHAESLMREVADIRFEQLGPDHVETASAYMDLGMVLNYAGRHAEAEPYAAESVRVFRAAPEADVRIVANSLRNLASAQLGLDQAVTAEATLREAIDWLERRGVSYPEDHAATLSDLGGILNHQGRHAEAEPILRQALALYRSLPGQDDVSTSSAMTSLANALMGQGMLLKPAIIEGRAGATADPEDMAEAMALIAEAETIHRRVFAATEPAFGRNHPVVVNALANLVIALANQNKLAEAETVQNDVVARYLAAYGLRHPDVGTAYYNLANLMRLQLRLQEALPVYRQALEIKRATLTAPHTGIANVLNNMASTLLLLERNDEAMVALDEALPMKVSIYCPNPQTADGCPGHPEFTPSLAAYGVLRFGIQDRVWAGVRMMSWAEDVALRRTRLRYSAERAARAEFKQQVYIHRQFVSIAWGASRPEDQDAIAADFRAYLLPDLPVPD